MRLTLRTLLAYRDGVLNAADAESLHQRIQQSEDAANLLRRIERLSQDYQNPSATIVGKGLGGDPNFVAEYVDDVLQREKVPEMERVCLESDTHLAELAACHRLLATALHTRVQLPDELKELAYSIVRSETREQIKSDLRARRQTRSTNPNSAELLSGSETHPTAAQSQSSSPASEQGQPVDVHAPMLASGGGSIKQQGLNLEGASLSHEVPEYLIGTKAKNWSLPAAILLLLVLLAVLLRVSLGPWEQFQGLFARAEPASVTALPSLAADDDGSKSSEADGLNEEVLESQEEPPLSGEVPSAAMGDPSAKDATADASNADNLAGQNENPNGSLEANSMEGGQQDPGQVGGGLQTAAEGAPTAAWASWEPERGELPALVLVSSPEGNLELLSPGQEVPTGASIIIPPSNVANLVFSDGWQWKAVGPTNASLDKATLSLNLGRGMLQAGDTGFSVKLRTASTEIQLDLPAKATAAIELGRRRESHGSVLDPSTFKQVLVVVAVNGNVDVFQSAEQKQYALQIGEGLALIEGQRPKQFKLQSIPAWYRLQPERAIDREGVLELVTSLRGEIQAGKSLTAAIQKQTLSRRPEEAALAIQTSLLLGDVQALVRSGFLGNPRMSIYWQSTLELLRQVMANQPPLSEELNTALSDTYPEGDKLYAMIQGLNPEQLAAGGIGKLIEELGSTETANRVLAFDALQRLTGQKLGFLPGEPNRASLLAWRRELATERLAVLPVGDIIWERKLP